ncbi:hypothetical protein ACFVT8_02425 [Lysinibacillus sp. NPDC058147]|uniref:hypothetical protein n=1 Tax=unclassified Lysinibacillus TaxID=2636778 RepID=UPI0036DEB7B0
MLPHLGKYKVKSFTTHVLQQFIYLSLNHAVYSYIYIKENPYVELMKDNNRKPTREDLKIQSKENLRSINSVLNER